MKENYKTYLLYFSVGLNLAFLVGMLLTGMIEGETDWFEQPHKEEHEEWREFERRMTKLERKTRPLHRQIAKQQRKLLRALKDQTTDTSMIRAINNEIHRYQRRMQNRTLEILLKQRQNLSDTDRRRVFDRLLKRHRTRYRSLYEDSHESEEHHESETE
jgi:hypothetical protein